MARGRGSGKANSEKILDAAERLFAKRGFYGVTVREIAKAAGVDVALVSYYYGKKKELFETVFKRRAEEINRERLAALEDAIARADGGVPSVEAIIAAFTEPLYEKAAKGGHCWKHYLALVAQVDNSPEWGGQLMSEAFDPLVRRFIAELKKALPDASEEDIYWSYHFFSGALVLTFGETGRIDNLSEGVAKSSDLEAVYSRMPRFIAAGFRGLCRQRRTPERAAADDG